MTFVTKNDREESTNRIVSALVALSLAAFASVANAEVWPAKPIKWIVPFAPGGTTDILARTIGEKLARALGEPVIVENKPGAGGGVGADFTISTHAINA